MNLCLVTNLYPPVQTGSSYYAHDLAQALAGRGHEVCVVTCASGRFTAQEVDGDVTVFRLPSIGLPRTRFLLGFDEFRLGMLPGNVRRLTGILEERAIDLVHQSGHLLDLTYASLRAARRVGIPAVCSVHTVIQQPGRPRLDQLTRVVDRNVVGRLAMDRFECILALDGEIERYVTSRYRARAVRRIPWGISFDFGRYERRRHGPAGPLRIVSLGHVTEMRSRAGLIEAAAMLRDEGVPFEMRIVGKLCTDGPQAHVTRLGLDQHVTFTGELPHETVLDELCNADLEAHFITNPGVGSASMEAMAVGLPTMLWASPDTLGFAELRHLDNAVLVDPADPATIAALLRKLDGDRDLLDRIGRNGRRTAMKSFAWPSVAESMEQVYREVLAKRA